MPYERGLEVERRFDWINAFLTSSLNASLVSSGISLSQTLRFDDVNTRFVSCVLKRAASLSNFPDFHIKRREEADYLFHLESELWGSDCHDYTYFRQRRPMPHSVLQTFLVVHGFILVERWLHGAFLSPEQRKETKKEKPGRAGKRRILFGKDAGILSVKYKECFAALGPPYCLLGSTTKVDHILDSNEWADLKHAFVPTTLRKFYLAISDKQHFCQIIEASFMRSREKLPRQIYQFPKPINRRETRGLKATWYDVLWIYSESIRYRPIAPSSISLGHPYSWNRSIRWGTPLLISGLLCLMHKSDGDNVLREAWQNAIANNAVMKDVFNQSRDGIF